VADLPFMSYTSREQALANSVRLMQEGGARMVKLESGAEQLRIVEFLAGHDIAVCAHLGLKPQSVHKTGGFRVQGREQAAAELILQEARDLQSAGADIVLLESFSTGAPGADFPGARPKRQIAERHNPRVLVAGAGCRWPHCRPTSAVGAAPARALLVMMR
jgi:hypothetical protein